LADSVREKMQVRKVVIPAAGLGTRLYPATIEQPKEMLPIFCKGRNGGVYVKPLLQSVFEQIFDFGIRNFCFIVGRGKRAIEDHFAHDEKALKVKKPSNKLTVSEVRRFYRMVDRSNIVWVNQPSPRGFGDAVYRARYFIGDEPFLVYAGDTYIAANADKLLKNLVDVHSKYGSDATFVVDEVEDPRIYGVIEGERVAGRIYSVKRIVEKPKVAPSKLAVVALYLFNPVIFKMLERVGVDERGEKQLTDAIQMLVEGGFKVYALKLGSDNIRVDIGNPTTYWDALRVSYGRAK